MKALRSFEVRQSKFPPYRYVFLVEKVETRILIGDCTQGRVAHKATKLELIVNFSCGVVVLAFAY
jgi:hypothetical protein